MKSLLPDMPTSPELLWKPCPHIPVASKRKGPVPCHLQLTEESLLVAIPVREDADDPFDNQENSAAAANSRATAPRSAAVDGAGQTDHPACLLAGRVLSMQASELRGAMSLVMAILRVHLLRLYLDNASLLRGIRLMTRHNKR